MKITRKKNQASSKDYEIISNANRILLRNFTFLKTIKWDIWISIAELDIDTFKSLKEQNIAEQMKKKS